MSETIILVFIITVGAAWLGAMVRAIVDTARGGRP